MSKKPDPARTAAAPEVPAIGKEPDDAELLAGIAGGDERAFRLFLGRHLSAILAFARRYVRTHADAEDIAQEAFTRVWLNAGRWQAGQAPPRSWLHRIAYHLCIDELRRSQPLTGASDHRVAEHTPESALVHEACQQRVRQAVRSLPERQRTALWLCAYQGLSNKEAAATLQTSVEALESLLARARRTLREKLQAVEGIKR